MCQLYQEAGYEDVENPLSSGDDEILEEEKDLALAEEERPEVGIKAQCI